MIALVCLCVSLMIWHQLDEQHRWLCGNEASCWHTNTSTWSNNQAETLTLRLYLYGHTHTHTRGGFGVQRMFYFGNSFGLVTLHWWQTEKQVANIKHFTSTATCSNTHANTQTHKHTQTHILALLVFPSFLSLLIPRNISPKGGCVVLNLLACFSFTSS